MKRQETLFIIAISFLGIFFSLKNIQAYDPPIGIPDPNFGIDEVRPPRPDLWDSEIPGYYYVNYQTGTDSANTFGMPEKPRKTIPITLPAGSYVEVHGTYSHIVGGITKIIGNGTGGTWVAGISGPVWIVGENEEMRPDFNKRLVVVGSYIYFDTIRLFETGAFQVGSATTGNPADHIMLRNSEGVGSIGFLDPLVAISGASSTPVSNVVIYNNNLHDVGDVTSTNDQDAHVTTVGNHVSNAWFLENTFHTSSGSGAHVGGAYSSAGHDNCHHIYYGKNHVYNTRQAGLGVKYASDVIFAQNNLHDIIDTRELYSISASPSKGVGFQYAPNRLWILYNTIHNASYGIYGGSTNDINIPPNTAWYIYAIGNIIYDIKQPNSVVYRPENSWSEAGIMMAGGTYRYIINNTIFNAVGGIYCPSPTAYYMDNNIVSNISVDNGYHVFMDSGYGADVSTLNNSIFYQGNRAEKIRWSSANIGNLSVIQSVAGVGTGSLNADPKFIDFANNDFKLQSGSPAINSGVAHEVYDSFFQRYGLSIKRDLEDSVRPQDMIWDIGAYEYIPIQNPVETCSDSIQNQGETGIDCGGVCDTCAPAPTTYNLSNFISLIDNWLGIGNETSNVNSDSVVNTKDLGIMMSNWSN